MNDLWITSHSLSFYLRVSLDFSNLLLRCSKKSLSRVSSNNSPHQNMAPERFTSSAGIKPLSCYLHPNLYFYFLVIISPYYSTCNIIYTNFFIFLIRGIAINIPATTCTIYPGTSFNPIIKLSLIVAPGVNTYFVNTTLDK